jgi:type IV secretion system protein VirB2
LALAVLIGSAVSYAAETGSNLPWEGPLNTLVTSLTGPVAYAISVIAIVALGATLAFASGEMGETMKRLLQIGIAVCLVVFAAQVMSSFIGQAAEVSLLQPVHAVAQPALRLIARG